MARGSGGKGDLVKCEYCGEMYSTTYKHCPFCNEDGTGRWDDPEGETSRGGGRRLAGGGGGGARRGSSPAVGTIIGGILSLILIIAAICIIFSIVKPLLGKDKPTTSTPTPPVASQPAESAPVESQPVESTPPATTAPQPTTPALDVIKPTSFTLSKDDMTFFHVGEYWDLKVNMVPANATAEVTWKSSDPNIATVSWNGRVTAVSKGTVTITATIEGVGEKTCITRCSFENDAPAATTQPGGETVSGLTISRVDFTLAYAGDSWRLLVDGTDSPITWTSSNTEVATVDADGRVTAVGKGTCTVTAEVDGTKLDCIVRCSWQ